MLTYSIIIFNFFFRTYLLTFLIFQKILLKNQLSMILKMMLNYLLLSILYIIFLVIEIFIFYFITILLGYNFNSVLYNVLKGNQVIIRSHDQLNSVSKSLINILKVNIKKKF